MSDPTPVPPVLEPVQAVANDVSAAVATPEVQAVAAAVESSVGPKIPANVRSVFYEVVKWAGLLGAGATAVAATALHGDAQLYVATGGFVLTSIVSTFAKVHVTK